MLRLLGALLLTCAAGAWSMAFFGVCPARLGFALSLMCGGLAWALVPLWASRDAEMPIGPSAKVKAQGQARRGHTLYTAPQLITSPNAKDHAQRFGRDMLEPATVNTPVVRLHSAYLDWCAELGEEPCGTREIGAELAALFERTGVAIVDVGGTRCVSRARIRALRRSRAIGLMGATIRVAA